MRPDAGAEIVFLLSIFLLAVSFVIYGLIIKRLLNLIKKKGIWILPVLSALGLFLVAIFHLYRILYYFPKLARASGDLFELIIGSLRMARLENTFLCGAGFLVLVCGWLYYTWSSR
jgi:hypothetical protein